MRILVDSKITSSVPPGITRHEVRTAAEEGCAGLGLQALVHAAVERGFEGLLSITRGGRHPQLEMPPTFRLGLVPEEEADGIVDNLSAFLEILATSPAGTPGRPRVFGTVRTFFPAGDEGLIEDSIPEPDGAPGSQEEHLRQGIARFLASRGDFTSLTVFTSDRQVGFFISRRGKQVEFHEMADARTQPELEAAIRSFHATRGHAVITDYLSANGGIPNATRVMAFEVCDDSEQLLDVCLAALRDVHGVGAHDPLIVDVKSRSMPPWQLSRSKKPSSN